MMHETTRRNFLMQTGAMAGAAMLARRAAGEESPTVSTPTGKRKYGISLAAWSLHRTIGNGDGLKPMLDMPAMTRNEWNIDAIELVSGMMAGVSPEYLAQLKKNADDNKIDIRLIMIDGQGAIGHRRENFRQQAVEKHKVWVDAAAELGCYCIRMNWQGEDKDWQENPESLKAFIDRSVPGFRELCDYGDRKNISVNIENHWGPSSYIEPLTGLMKAVDHPRFGTLPDFGNFPDDVDRYEAVDAFMPYAKAVSAKCYDFDDNNNETKIDYEKMIGIVCDKHGYDGFIGIEYEGEKLPEAEGIRRCNELLKRLRG